MRVIVHSPEPKRQPTGIGFENCETQLGKALENAGENKMPQRGHVVARKTERVIQPAQRELRITAALAFELAERMKAAVRIFARSGDRKIQLGGDLPKRVIFCLVQITA